MLTLRNRIGLTQAGLATHLNISRRAVGEWEAGKSYPKAEHLKELIALGVMQQAFPPGHEAEEILLLWKAAHQKMLLDERWLSTLLDQQEVELGRLQSPITRQSALFSDENTLQKLISLCLFLNFDKKTAI
jgi:transcriptional regulator with XRE-family HTH domain